MAIYGTLGGQDSTSTGYPSIRPTLDLNFAQTKTLDPRVTFYRDSLATYTDSLGIIRTVSANVPRFDHDPITGESLGLLIEESRTNLFVYSENFEDVNWSKSAITVTPNSVVSPDGTQDADLIVPTTELLGHFIVESRTFSSGVTYTLTGYAKPAGYNIFRLSFPGTIFETSGRQASFDLSTGTVGLAGTGVTADISAVENGWYRCRITATCINSGSGICGFTINNIHSLAAENWSGDGTSGVHIWGAQVEEGSFPTSYIPTTALSVTRSADTAYITNPQFTFPCTIVANYDTQVLQYARRLYEIIPTGASGTTSIRPLIQNTGAFDFFSTYISSMGTSNSTSTNTSFKFAHSIGLLGTSYTNDRVSLNGATTVTSASTTTLNVNTPSTLTFGNANSGDSPRIWCGHIRSFSVYSSGLSSTQLQNLTAL
jgi:hypothetical protein